MTDEGSDRYGEALRRGHVAVTRGRPREAIAYYEEAARLGEQRALPFAAMGSVLLQMRQPREALRAYDAALARAPGDLDALRGKAAALEAEGHPAEARELLRKAQELEAWERGDRPDGQAEGQRRRDLERLVAEGEQARTMGELDRAAVAFLSAARGYAAEGVLDAALDACLRAVEAQPGSIDVHFTLAHLYLVRGWADHGVQRIMLIDRRLSIDEDPRRRAALQALARDFQGLAPELEAIASTPA
jgi:tetratricopeptide (TPR) repeat protein